MATLRCVTDFEREYASVVRLNISELDPVCNVNDHTDHLMTVRAALDAVEDLTAACRLHYVCYASPKLPEHLSGQGREMKCAAYAITLAGVSALDHPISWWHYNQTFIGRTYFRVEDKLGQQAH